MIYYTQLIFIKPEQEEIFNSFEDKVLPLLERYNGVLAYRIRPTKANVIATTLDYPYEIHVVTFPTEADFEGYRDDMDRIKYLPLKEQSIEKVLLIKGTLI